MMLASPTPTPTGATTSTPGFGPDPSSPSSGASAGLDAFLIVVALIAVTAVIMYSMTKSLKRMRTNLGGNVLPRREADQLPVRPQDPVASPHPEPDVQPPPAAEPPAGVPPPDQA
jgi:hypothetical protein